MTTTEHAPLDIRLLGTHCAAEHVAIRAELAFRSMLVDTTRRRFHRPSAFSA
jgi:hypothetical protein